MTDNLLIKNKYAVVFPGQGSQSIGMLADIAAQFDEVQQTFTQASDALGYDLWQLTQHASPEKLDKTMYTQPALLTASYSIWKILSSRTSTKPAALAGHSLGEYTALVCANVLDFSAAIKLVAARGEYMQDAVAPGEGAMAALIGLDENTVLTICKEAITSNTEVLSPANYNSLGQVVVAGHKAPVERAILLAKQHGAKLAMLIPVSVPSHCQLMLPAAERLAALLATTELQAPTIPVVNNVDVSCYTDDNAIRDALVRQLHMPVRWVDTIQAFIKMGVTSIIECGPGKVLTGLNKRIDKSLQLMTTSDLTSLEALLKIESERN